MGGACPFVPFVPATEKKGLSAEAKQFFKDKFPNQANVNLTIVQDCLGSDETFQRHWLDLVRTKKSEQMAVRALNSYLAGSLVPRKFSRLPAEDAEYFLNNFQGKFLTVRDVQDQARGDEECKNALDRLMLSRPGQSLAKILSSLRSSRRAGRKRGMF